MNTSPIVRCHRTLSRLVVVRENLRAIAVIGEANGKVTLFSHDSSTYTYCVTFVVENMENIISLYICIV